MPEYLSILREASVTSIYLLFLIVLILFFIKGRIRERELATLFYFWLPIAVISQFIMTYYRLGFGKSNLSIMNIYLMLEFMILVSILLRIRQRMKNIEINYKIWSFIIIGGVLIHFLDTFNSLHNAAILYIAIVYFQLTVNSIDLNKIDEMIKDPYILLNITIFVKAFGYSYFLIYQADYKFPLSIYSGVNLIVQILFALTLFQYYRQNNAKLK